MILASQGMTPYKPLFDEFLRLPPPPTNRQAVIAAQATVRALPKSVALEPNIATYTAAFDAMLEGKKTVRETCEDLDRHMNLALTAK